MLPPTDSDPYKGHRKRLRIKRLAWPIGHRTQLQTDCCRCAIPQCNKRSAQHAAAAGQQRPRLSPPARPSSGVTAKPKKPAATGNGGGRCWLSTAPQRAGVRPIGCGGGGGCCPGLRPICGCGAGQQCLSGTRATPSPWHPGQAPAQPLPGALPRRP